MKIHLSSDSVIQAKVDLIAVGARGERFAEQPEVQRLDRAMGGALQEHAKDEGFKGAAGSVLKVPTRGRVQARWVVLVGLGAGAPQDRQGLLVADAGARAARKHRSLAIVAPVDTEHAVRSCAEGAVTGAYQYSAYLTGPRKPRGGLRSASVLVSEKTEELQGAVSDGQVMGESINFARDLVNAPPNDMNPPALANAAQQACKDAGVKCTVWNKARIEKEGMNLFLAVNRGSGVEPRLIHTRYQPPGAKKRVVFVGKGLTFDAGGLCLKPPKSMVNMKCDMGGAATTLGIVLAAAQLELPIEVHGLIGSTENMTGQDAYRPGDVFTSREGKTVEIINTDAEGRLVLADVLNYACELKPHYLVDHATLTGACMVALGQWTAGLYSNDETLAQAYADAAASEGESFWRLPLDEDLRETLKSDVADLKHVGNTFGGSITAALFLREFVDRSKWVHCDIAGPAFLDGPHKTMPKGGTGFGVATGVAFLRALSQ